MNRESLNRLIMQLEGKRCFRKVLETKWEPEVLDYFNPSNFMPHLWPWLIGEHPEAEVTCWQDDCEGLGTVIDELATFPRVLMCPLCSGSGKITLREWTFEEFMLSRQVNGGYDPYNRGWTIATDLINPAALESVLAEWMVTLVKS